jgi:hypothetical protein
MIPAAAGGCVGRRPQHSPHIHVGAPRPASGFEAPSRRLSGPVGRLTVPHCLDPIGRPVREIEPRRPALPHPPGIGSNRSASLGDLHNHLRGHRRHHCSRSAIPGSIAVASATSSRYPWAKSATKTGQAHHTTGSPPQASSTRRSPFPTNRSARTSLLESASISAHTTATRLSFFTAVFGISGGPAKTRHCNFLRGGPGLLISCLDPRAFSEKRREGLPAPHATTEKEPDGCSGRLESAGTSVMVSTDPGVPAVFRQSQPGHPRGFWSVRPG